MKKLVVFFGAIGDTILFSPALQKLSEINDVHTIGYPERMALLEKVGWVKKTYHPDEIDFSSIFSTPSKKLTDFLIQFNTIFFFLRDGDILVKNMESLGISQVYTFPGTPPENWTSHASEYYLNCFGFQIKKDFILPIQAKHIHNEIIIHPGSGSERKNFPLDFFLSLTQKLIDKNFSVRWCIGPAEEKFEIPSNIPLLQKENLVELAEYIAGATAYMGNDSGISHISGAIGVKTIVLFRSTDPKVWCPLGPHVFPLTFEKVSIENILDIVCSHS